MIGYIYCITCLVNDKLYFGQTRRRTVKSRFRGHLDSVQKGSDNKLHRAIRKYGEENFIIEEVVTVEASTKKALKSKLDFLEKHFIKRYDTFKNGYNSTLGGEGCLGKEMSEETKKRLSELNFGENNPMFGKKQSLSSRLKLSKALKGRISSLRGRNLSEEHKRKIAISHIGKFHSEESRLKLSLTKRSKHIKLSDEEKLRRSLKLGGKPIFQFTVDGELIKEWVSLRSIYNELPIDRSRLKKHIFKGTVYHGSIWKYNESVCKQ